MATTIEKREIGNEFKSGLCLSASAMALVLATAGSVLAAPAIATSADVAVATAAADSTNKMDEVVVTGRKSTTIKGALDEKRVSIGVTEVMSAEEIAERPGADIVDVVSHLPGLSAFADMGLGQAATGEAEYLTIRGIDSSYNAYTINGIRAPQADPSSRALSLTMLAPYGLEAVKVYKTPTADLDGDAIGGIIDFRTPTAFDFSGAQMFKVTAQGNYANLADQTGAKDLGAGGQLEFARKFNNNLGLYVTAYYDERNSAGEAVESLGYTPTLASQAQATNYANLPGGLSATGVRFDYYNDDIKRYGGNFSLDFQKGANKFYVQGSYAKYDVEGEDTQHSIIGGGGLLYSNGQTFSPIGLLPGSYFQDRNEVEQLITAKVGGENQFTDRLTTEYSASYGLSSILRPDYVQGSLYGVPDVTGGVTSVNLSNPAHVQIGYTSAATQAYAQTEDIDHLWKYQGEDEGSYDTVYTSKFDLNYRLDTGVLKTIRAGIDVNVANRIQYDHEFFGNDGDNFGILGPGGVVEPYYGAAGPAVSQLPGRNVSFLNGDFVGPFRIYDRSTFANGVNPFAYTSQFGISPTTGQVVGNPGAYTINDYERNTVTGTEAIYAAYAETNMQWRDVLATAGVRYEDTDFSSRQWVVDGDTGNFVRNDHNYGEVLPNLNLTWRPDPMMVVRGAIRQSFTRPAFGLIAAPETVSRNPLTDQIAGISEGNPNLKPATATNYDASAEFYGPHTSVIAVDLYYKRINDFIYASTSTGAPPSANVASITNQGVVTTMAENGKDADLLGTEVSVRRDLDELPGVLGGLGLGGSVTAQRSSADSGRADHFGRRTPLPRAPNLIYNLDLYYKKYGATADLGYHYEGLQLVGLTSNNLDEYLQPVKTLDFSVSYPVYGVVFTVAAKNLLDDVLFYKTLGKTTQYLGTQDGGGNGSYVETGRFVTVSAAYKW